jgi:hypothetical protein
MSGKGFSGMLTAVGIVVRALDFVDWSIEIAFPVKYEKN